MAKEKDDTVKEQTEKTKEGLKKQGMDPKTANKVLKAWREAVGKDIEPGDLRKLLTQQAGKASLFVVFQILLDLAAAYGSFVAGSYLSAAASPGGIAGFFTFLLQAGAFFVTGYYLSGAVFDAFKLGVLLYSSLQFQTNSAAYLAALQEIAGDQSTGLATVDKAREAVNSVKVLGALKEIQGLLKPGRLEDLRSPGGASAYITLDRASKYGFDAKKYGISEEELSRVASVFARYDTNDDGVLSVDEFRGLCSRYGSTLSQEEVKAALDLLDTNKDGRIQFGEFVDWWVEKSGVETKAAAA
ncbi:Calmodulin-4 [Auxenochlorella protothecoides]|uniref:Calmodulin-4 n=1 Tax=Auxenochlorella protothecoides TaxID=3075 RepID=A0A087SBK7_AUXPR|nr:Calmodulin-4 [Auxenochlorella protothecoides]KFM23111.1 Calmodulin-4 [Auxenochlorella protothecoides]